MFKVEIRKDCKICGKPIKEKRFRTYCSKQCRNKANTIKYKDYRSIWQREGYDRKSAVPSDKKKQCGICGHWYVQVGSHVVLRHGMTAREYREQMNLPLKRGIVPAWYRKMKAQQCKENGTIKNLKKGKANWYKKGDRLEKPSQRTR